MGSDNKLRSRRFTCFFYFMQAVSKVNFDVKEVTHWTMDYDFGLSNSVTIDRDLNYIEVLHFAVRNIAESDIAKCSIVVT